MVHVMIKKGKRQSKYFAPQNDVGDYHVCDHPGCTKAGEYRAPKNARLKEYYWFCLDHVKEYNSKWNYYEDEYSSVDEDYSNHFRFSSHFKYNFDFDFKSGYDFFSQSEIYTGNTAGIRLTPEERQALKIMELDYDDLSVDSLKKAYKKAVKKYHPDINQTTKSAEEIFKIISTSYKTLLAKLSAQK